MPSTPTFPPTGPASDDGLAPDRPVSDPPPEGSKWSVGTLVYTRQGLVRLFTWLLWGDFAWQVRDRVLAPVIGLVLKRQLEVQDKTFALLTGTIPSAISLFLGPVVSFRSDRLRTRRGRRIPFLLVSAPAAAVAIVGMGFGPALGAQLHTLPMFRSFDVKNVALVVLGAWYVVYDFSSIITNAMFGALINDTVPHGLIGRFYGLFRVVSLSVAIVFNGFLLATAENHYEWTFALIAMVYGVGIVAMCLKVREGDYPPPPPAGTGESVLGRCFKTPRTFGVALLVHAVLAGTYLTASASLLQRLVPREDFAQFASAYGIVASGFNIVLPLLLGATLDHFDHDYRLTFYAGSFLGFLALGCLTVVYRDWRQHGGPHHFTPPEAN